MSGSSHKVGIVAQNSTDIHTLRTVATEAGLHVTITVEFFRWNHERQPLGEDIEAWIVNLDFEDLENRFPEKVDALMDVPGQLILCEGGSPPTPADPDFASWKRRTLEKFQDIAGDIALEDHDSGAPETVWVLAGSIGGPDAIRVFLENLEPDLGVAFVYANHLQTDFEAGLARAVGKNSPYPAAVAQHGGVLGENQVTVISPEFVTSLKPNGTLTVSKEPWSGVYQPNLDYVVSSVAKSFGHTGGVIIFSGMCDDGAGSCRIMKQNGGQVWVQHPISCVSSQMPDEAIKTGCVDKMGTPEELAWALAEYIKQSDTKAATT